MVVVVNTTVGGSVEFRATLLAMPRRRCRGSRLGSRKVPNPCTLRMCASIYHQVERYVCVLCVFCVDCVKVVCSRDVLWCV